MPALGTDVTGPYYSKGMSKIVPVLDSLLERVSRRLLQSRLYKQ